MGVLINNKYLLKFNYQERYIPTIIRILRNNNAIYSVYRRQKIIKVEKPSMKCRLEILSFIQKHKLCDICNSHRARYRAIKGGKEVFVCSFCKSDLGLKNINKISSNIAIHHDLPTGILGARQ